MSKNEIKCVHLVYFSPSGSTEKIVRKIASGIEGVETKRPSSSDDGRLVKSLRSVSRVKSLMISH